MGLFGVVNTNILAATHTEQLSGDSFNIGNGDNYSVNELADIRDELLTNKNKNKIQQSLKQKNQSNSQLISTTVVRIG